MSFSSLGSQGGVNNTRSSDGGLREAEFLRIEYHPLRGGARRYRMPLADCNTRPGTLKDFLESIGFAETKTLAFDIFYVKDPELGAPRRKISLGTPAPKLVQMRTGYDVINALEVRRLGQEPAVYVKLRPKEKRSCWRAMLGQRQ